MMCFLPTMFSFTIPLFSLYSRHTVICHSYYTQSYSLPLVFFSLSLCPQNILFLYMIFLILSTSNRASSLQTTQHKKSTALTLSCSTLLFSWLTLHTTCIHCIMCLFIWLMSVYHTEMCQKGTETDIYLRWQDILFSV